MTKLVCTSVDPIPVVTAALLAIAGCTGDDLVAGIALAPSAYGICTEDCPEPPLSGPRWVGSIGGELMLGGTNVHTLQVPSGAGALSIHVVPTLGSYSLTAESDTGPVDCVIEATRGDGLCRIVAPPEGDLRVTISGHAELTQYELEADARPGLDVPLLDETIAGEAIERFSIEVPDGALEIEATADVRSGSDRAIGLALVRVAAGVGEPACETTANEPHLARCFVDDPIAGTYEVVARGAGAAIHVSAMLAPEP